VVHPPRRRYPRLESGFRFIYRKPDGSLSATRGQARIPDADQLLDLLREAQRQGWFKPTQGKLE